MHDQLTRLAAAVDARPAELVGLLVLLIGGALATVLLVAAADAGPSPIPVLVEGSGATVTAPSDGAADVTVHVAGAVRRPGIVHLSVGARVADAIRAAGGARTDAQLDALNLAMLVEDGQQVLVPSTVVQQSSGGQRGAVDGDGRIDLNRASAQELEQLPGIGPVLAARIVAWRDEHGPFREPGELRQVPGIGERTFQSLTDRIRI